MTNFILFFKGLLIGIGKIIPGVSGSLIAVVLNVYEKAISAINHIGDDFKKSICFLLPIGCGVIISVILLSHVLLFFLNSYFLYTIFFFLGLLLGTIPKFRCKLYFKNFKDYFLFFLCFFLPFSLKLFTVSKEFIPDYGIVSYIFIFFLGMIDAFSMVIPGISGTALFLMLGSYSFVLKLLSNPFSQIFYCLLFGGGLVLGVFLASRLVGYCYRKCRNQFSIIIYGFLWSSLFAMFFMVVMQISLGVLLQILILILLGFLLSYRFFS